MNVSKLSFLAVFCYFALYVGLHIIIGVVKQKIEKEKQDTEEYKKRLQVASFLYKWFPAIYVVFLLIMLY